uniref:Beta-lactamase domain protein n=1 Tax=Magnetococcus massalia (strain MO-1) TaxID=451514 RepID=A0A1S7LQ67_MAGMO|nr:MBL fold metallo-hydrolase [Candidatus Magnetococcus massalia]CRH08247.1 Beta-lactamase domain protein [Candidatus Magnetococcus massalia]CRH08314.1 Beta-lactamase domain protein [Candidatus Magnetococcus massalia]
MKIRFWGVRGSIASPGTDTVRYGGNTTCIEVRTDDNHVIILDGGTGIFPLAQSLLRELPVTCNIFITHTHWDHIQGLPFFIPQYIPANKLVLHGAHDPVAQRDLRQILSYQYQYCYFPVREVELKANLEYVTLKEYQSVQVGDAVVSCIYMNHPVLNFGYRIDCNGKSVFFTGDHEPIYNIYDDKHHDHEEYSRFIEQKDLAILDFIKDVDVLIADTSYTEEEYEAKRGWGHGTYDTSVALAKAANAKHLFFTHHEPTRNDDQLEQIYQTAMNKYPRKEGDPHYYLAQEGLEFEV